MTAPSPLVVSLAAYRTARDAARFLRSLLHEPSWLEGVTVEIDREGVPRVLVWLLQDGVLVRRCIATKVNGVDVRVRAR